MRRERGWCWRTPRSTSWAPTRTSASAETQSAASFWGLRPARFTVSFVPLVHGSTAQFEADRCRAQDPEHGVASCSTSSEPIRLKLSFAWPWVLDGEDFFLSGRFCFKKKCWECSCVSRGHPKIFWITRLPPPPL